MGQHHNRPLERHGDLEAPRRRPLTKETGTRGSGTSSERISPGLPQYHLVRVPDSPAPVVGASGGPSERAR
jgi:hypothetical protein